MNSDNLNTIEKVLDFAIDLELEAQEFYTDLAAHQKKADIKKMLLQFVEEEKRHQQKLETAKREDLSLVSRAAFDNFNLLNYMIEIEPGENMDSKDILLLAMQKEKRAFSLYLQLAGMVENNKLQDLFLMLAREEANHKLHFELEYDKAILTEH